VIPTQTTRTSASPVADVREGASPSARTGVAWPVNPPTEPGRPAQTCSQCRRTAPAKVTINLPGYRWRLCATCVSRGDKTTELAPVDCEHRFSRRSTDGTTCIDCFEPLPGPPERDVEHLRDCGLCRETGRARISSVLSIAFIVVVLLGLAGATGKLGAFIRWLPMPEPVLNGYPLAVLLVVYAGGWWRMLGATTTPHEPDELTARRRLPRGTEPLVGATWPEPVELFPGDLARRVRPVVPRRVNYPNPPFGDLHPDPEEVRPTLLPINTEGRVRS